MNERPVFQRPRHYGLLRCAFLIALILFCAPHAGWLLQSSCKFTATAEQISTAGFKTEGWHSTDVPSTVVAALVADKTYPDPYFGKNLRDIPGTTYPIGKNFSL